MSKLGHLLREIIAAFERCEGWSWDDRKRLAYLAIFTGYIEGRKYSTPTWVSLARLVMELERFENYPWGRVAFKVLMDSMKGRDISGCYTINGLRELSRSGCTQLCRNWVLIIVILSQTICLHRTGLQGSQRTQML